MEGWDWLDKLIAGAGKSSADDEKIMRGHQTARQVPPRSYRRQAGLCVPDAQRGVSGSGTGSSRNTGFAAAGMHPATLHILGEFLATGTQMKTERPGKACGVVPVDSIEGPTVRLEGGDVLRIDDEATAKTLTIGRENPRCRRDPHLVRGVPGEQPPARPLPATARNGGRLIKTRRQNRPKDETEALALARAGRYLHPGVYLVLGRYHGRPDPCLLADAVSHTGKIDRGVPLPSP